MEAFQRPQRAASRSDPPRRRIAVDPKVYLARIQPRVQASPDQSPIQRGLSLIGCRDDANGKEGHGGSVLMGMILIGGGKG